MRSIVLALALAVGMLLAPTVAGALTEGVSDSEIGFHAIHALPEVPARHDEALSWLAEHADKRAVVALVHLLRWQPDDVPTLRKTLQKITGDDAGDKWFDWMVWLREHPEYPPYQGFANFLGLSLASFDPQFLRFVHEGVDHDIR